VEPRVHPAVFHALPCIHTSPLFIHSLRFRKRGALEWDHVSGSFGMVWACIHTCLPICSFHGRLIYKEHTRTHAEGADPRVWALARAGLRVAWPPAISRIRDHGRSHPVVAFFTPYFLGCACIHTSLCSFTAYASATTTSTIKRSLRRCSFSVRVFVCVCLRPRLSMTLLLSCVLVIHTSPLFIHSLRFRKRGSLEWDYVSGSFVMVWACNVPWLGLRVGVRNPAIFHAVPCIHTSPLFIHSLRFRKRGSLEWLTRGGTVASCAQRSSPPKAAASASLS